MHMPKYPRKWLTLGNVLLECRVARCGAWHDVPRSNGYIHRRFLCRLDVHKSAAQPRRGAGETAAGGALE